MFFIILLFSFIFSLFNSQLLNPRVVRGGCLLLGNEIYYVGGGIGITSINNFKNSKEVYTLNLEEGFTMNAKVAPWKTIIPNNEQKNMTSPYAFKNDKPNEIIAFYADKQRPFQIQVYDANERKWSHEDRSDELLKLTGIKPSNLTSASSAMLFAQNDINNDEIVFTGTNIETSRIYSILAIYPFIKYNIKTNRLEKLDIKLNILDPFTFFLNGEYCLLSGKNKDKYKIPNTQLIKIDIKTNKITNQTLTGDIPKASPTQFNAVKVNNTIYYIDTDYYSKFSEIYTLDLNTFKWTRRGESVQKINDGTCVIHFNDHLIYSFGNDETGTTEKTTIIDTKEWKEVGTLPPLHPKNKTDDRGTPNEEDNKKENTNNTGILVGGIVGGGIGAILIILIILFIIYKRKQKLEKPPNMITEPIFIKHTNMLDQDINFRHSTLSTHFNEGSFTMKPEYIHVNKMVNMDQIKSDPSNQK